METMVAISAVELSSSAMVSILERGVQGELDHLAAELGELAGVIEGAQGPELVHGGDVVVLRGRVHEVEVRRFLTPRILRRRTTSARLVRWISGMVLINISCL